MIDSGWLELDRGQPAAALENLDAYLATGDSTLREQAMEGRALALGRLGRTMEEEHAWRDVLRDYPGSAYVGTAHERIRHDSP